MASKSSDFLSSQDPLQNPQTEETPSQESVQNAVIWFEETLETEEKLSQESVQNAAIGKEETLETDADRISDLPEPILLHILSFLPSTEEAARTSILSKRWQFLWMSVPARKFMHYCENCEFRTCQIDSHTSLAISNVKRILNEYTENPKLREFSIWFTYEDDEFRDQVDEFVRFAVDRNVEELTVSPRDEFWRDEYDLPEYVFENSMLTSLSLHYVSLNPAGEISWRNLKKLVLGFAGLTDDLVQKILRGSPGLECLEFELCYGVEQMNITSPGVKRLIVHNCHVDDMNRPVVYAINAPHVLSLRVSGFSSLERLLLVDVGSVVEATVELRMGFRNGVDEIEELWREILQDLQHTRELRMSAECVMVLNKIWRKGLRSPPLKCKCLRIQSFIRRSCFLGLVSLLESAPDLETLIINADPPFSSVVPCGFHDIINHLAYQTMSFKCLKTVEIAYLMEWDYECEIIKFLLKHGCVLETMIISVASTDGKQAVSMSRQVSHKLLGFECASRDVTVLFKQINEDTLHRLKAHYDFCLDPNIYILNGNEDYDFDLW